MTMDGDLLIECDDGFLLTTREELEKEDEYHSKLMTIPFFAVFKKWKTLYLWRTKVRKKKMHLARVSLQTNLFIVTQVCVCFNRLD